ncbi:MAG: 4'-phosphopantetheinyl transferase superfamily protein [Acidobacteriia bacterium]|nr:4'-phosphopantetheinyl transferase superfamily protein [Terriglobia bacterium]
MRELGPSQIHLWQYPIGDPPDARHLARAMTLLSDAEKNRCAAFHMEKHAAEYALSHAMLRLALSEYAPVRPEQWQLLTGEKGKPEIAAPALDTPLCFNLSHTDGFAVCVAGRFRHLGVDVENMNRRTSHQELAQRFFAPAESEYLRSLPPSLQREAFFRIWTLKEAYIKADGRGLSIPLDSFCFRFPTENPAQVALESNAQSNPDHWSFFEFRHGEDYRISIGAKGPASGTLQVLRLEAATLF